MNHVDYLSGWARAWQAGGACSRSWGRWLDIRLAKHESVVPAADLTA